jgi:hypothetical protein
MFSGAKSLAAVLVRPSSAVLLTEYTPSSCRNKCRYMKLLHANDLLLKIQQEREGND